MRLPSLFHLGPAASASEAKQKTLLAAALLAFILAVMYLSATLVAPTDLETKLIEGEAGYAIETDQDKYRFSDDGTVNVRLFVTAPPNSSVKVLRMSFAPLGGNVRMNGFVFQPSISGKQMTHMTENGTTNLLLYGMDIAGGGRMEIGALRFIRIGINEVADSVAVRVLGDEVLGCSPYHTELSVVETNREEPVTINFDTTDLFRIRLGPDDIPTPTPVPTVTPTPTPTPTSQPATRTVLSFIVPGLITRNAPFDLTICARDASGRPATSYRGKVMFYALGDPQSSLPRTYTFDGTEQNACKTFIKGATLRTTTARLLFALDLGNTRIWGLRRVIVTQPPRAFSQCLPPTFTLQDVVDATMINFDSQTGQFEVRKTTLEQKLNELRATCNAGNQLVDGLGKPVTLYRLTGCWGNPPVNYLEILRKQAEELAVLRQRYTVVTLTCNSSGIPIP